MQKRPKGIFITTSYFKNGRFLDATRSSLIKEMAKYCDSLTYIQLNDFEKDDDIVSIIKRSSPDFIFTINASGLSDEVVNYSKQHSVPLITWFTDSTSLLTAKYVNNSREGNFYHGCLGLDHEEKYNLRKHWLPFSTVTPHVENEFEGPGDMSFLGTCWHVQQFAQAASLGLRIESSDQILYGKDLYNFLVKGPLAPQNLISKTGEKIPAAHFLNMIASQKRSIILKAFEQFDLSIYGEEAWLFNLWPVAPSLLKKFEVRYALDHHELRAMMREHKISLNIFHPHNLAFHGGPNFRVLDSFAHGVPLLSEYNTGCAELFPEGECALYFHDVADGVLKAKELLGSKALRKSLARNAGNRVMDGFLHRHRIETFFRDAGLPCLPGASNIQIHSRALYPGMFNDEPLNSRVLIETIDYTQTDEFKNESYRYQLAYPAPVVQSAETAVSVMDVAASSHGKVYETLRAIYRIWFK